MAALVAQPIRLLPKKILKGPPEQNAENLGAHATYEVKGVAVKN